MVKIFTIVTGETWNAHRTYVKRVTAKVRLTEVQRLDESDVILVFCPVASRHGPDIDAALKEIPASKPAVLVVMNRNYNPNCPVYDSSGYVSQSEVLSVDCVFHESSGLFSCPTNDKAVEKTLQIINKYSEEVPGKRPSKRKGSPESEARCEEPGKSSPPDQNLSDNVDPINSSQNSKSRPPPSIQEQTEHKGHQLPPSESPPIQESHSTDTKRSKHSNKQDLSQKISKPKINIYSIVTGETWNAHRTYVERVTAKGRLTEVQRLDESDVILVFCPVGSHHATDINAALKEIPASKPAVLVVMNHTCHPNRPVYDSSDYVSQSDVLSVDCVFHESHGLFSCPTNDEAVEKTLQHIKTYSEEVPGKWLSKRKEGPESEASRGEPGKSSPLDRNLSHNADPISSSQNSISRPPPPSIQVQTDHEGLQLPPSESPPIRESHDGADRLPQKDTCENNELQPGTEQCDFESRPCHSTDRKRYKHSNEQDSGQKISKPKIKIFTIVTGETRNAHRTYVERVTAKGQLTEVQRLDESDVILVFCPVGSRHGPDIDAALKEIPASKPAVLVVMNHTCHPNRPVYDSSDYVSQSNVLSVDCVFHETFGLFSCPTNVEAVEKTLQHINKYSEEVPGKWLSERKESPESEASHGESGKSGPLDQNLSHNADPISSNPTSNSRPPPSTQVQTEHKDHQLPPSQKISKSKIKIFTIVTGETWNTHRTYMERLAAKVRLTEVQRLDESDVILVFCPVGSRCGPDIDAALKKIPASTPAVLVVMNHNYNPNCPVYDSSGYVSQSDVLSVDCVFHESQGLFRCPTNDGAVEKTLQHIKTYSEEVPGKWLSKRKEGPESEASCGEPGKSSPLDRNLSHNADPISSSQNSNSRPPPSIQVQTDQEGLQLLPSQKISKSKIKIFTIVTGETWNAHRTYVERVTAKGRLTEVQLLDESDVILVFCPVGSRHGPDIDAALKEIPASKPAVLVVMNHTCHPDRPVYDSSDYVSQSDVLSVDCVFHESQGLFRCPTNDGAVEKTLQHLKTYSEGKEKGCCCIL